MKSIAKFSWQELQKATQGKAVSHHRHFDAVVVETDTRALQGLTHDTDVEVFFIPIVGENFDGHSFIEEAYHKNVAGCLVNQSWILSHPDLNRFPNLIVVPDTTLAYLSLGQFHRERVNPVVVGITGSSGKTTVKDMLFDLLSPLKKCQKTAKNHNNEIGVAQTLLGLEDNTDILIVEMAMRGPGQISPLSTHAKPDIALITNIGPAHIGLLGTLEAIAEAKLEIVDGLDVNQGLLIVNADDALLTTTAEKKWTGDQVTFSLHEVENIKRLPTGVGFSFEYQDVVFKLGIPGAHNVSNMLGCLKICEKLNIRLKSISNALEEFGGSEGRWQQELISAERQLYVINDAYNANPSSMRASLTSFWEMPSQGKQKVAVLGHMAELGTHESRFLSELAEWLVNHQADIQLVFIGEAMRVVEASLKDNDFGQGERIQWFANTADAAHWLQEHIPQNAIYLLKASREAALEKMIPLLAETTNNQTLSVQSI